MENFFNRIISPDHSPVKRYIHNKPAKSPRPKSEAGSKLWVLARFVCWTNDVLKT